MIDKGANPFIVDGIGKTQFKIDNLSNLSNLPTQKSIFFTTRPLPDEFKEQSVFPDPWFYETGVFDGKFVRVIGNGAAGTVVEGEWFGQRAAFKFVDIGNQRKSDTMRDGLKSLDKKLSELTAIQATKGSKIVSLYGHYR